jgi:hypothetical protein
LSALGRRDRFAVEAEVVGPDPLGPTGFVERVAFEFSLRCSKEARSIPFASWMDRVPLAAGFAAGLAAGAKLKRLRSLLEERAFAFVID